MQTQKRAQKITITINVISMGIRRTKSDELDIFGQELETATNDSVKAESSDYSQQRNERIELLLIQNMEAIKSLSLEVKDLSNRVKTIEKNMDTISQRMCNDVAQTLKQARFVGNLDSETYTKLKSIFNPFLFELKNLQNECIKKSEKLLDNHIQRLREIQKDNEGIWFSTLGLKIWAGTILVCVCWYHSFMPV